MNTQTETWSLVVRVRNNMAVGQNQWYHFGVGATLLLVYFSGDWDVQWGGGRVFYPWPYEVLKCECPLLSALLVLNHPNSPFQSALSAEPLSIHLDFVKLRNPFALSF